MSLGLEPPQCEDAPQILTQEDWNVVLYNGMASTSSWAALYFVALMTFGNYVLFNLLVAILVEGFQAEVSTGKGGKSLHTPCLPWRQARVVTLQASCPPRASTSTLRFVGTG